MLQKSYLRAIAAGTVPVYNGSKNKPEPQLLNHEAIIFIKLGEDNTDAVRLVKELHQSSSRYIEFATQPRYHSDAVEIIWSYYETLETKLKDILDNI